MIATDKEHGFCIDLLVLMMELDADKAEIDALADEIEEYEEKRWPIEAVSGGGGD